MDIREHPGLEFAEEDNSIQQNFEGPQTGCLSMLNFQSFLLKGGLELFEVPEIFGLIVAGIPLVLLAVLAMLDDDCIAAHKKYFLFTLPTQSLSKSVGKITLTLGDNNIFVHPQRLMKESMQETEQNMSVLRSSVYEYRKDSEFPCCDKHRLAQTHTCLGCSKSYLPICPECVRQDHSTHTLLQIRDVVPRLQKQLLEHWENIERQNNQIRNGYRRLDDNLQYCIDIFKSLKGQGDTVSIKGLEEWFEIVAKVKEWMTNPEAKNKKEYVSRFLYQFQEFIKKHGLEINDFKNLKFDQAEKKRIEAMEKQQRRINKIRKFVDSALIFSTNLDNDLQEQRKKLLIKPPPKLQFNIAKITSLNDPPPKLDKPQEVDELVLALKQNSKDQSERLNSLINNYPLLKCLDIKGDKVKVQNKTWQAIIDSFPNLLKLREMRLTLRGEDVPEVAKLFQLHKTKLRPIDRFHLKITDCKQLDIYWVYNLCNSFELSGLWVTLTRCNLDEKLCRQLIIGLNISTSMSNLPMSDLHLTLTSNKLDKKGETETSKLFDQRCKAIKRRSIAL